MSSHDAGVARETHSEPSRRARGATSAWTLPGRSLSHAPAGQASTCPGSPLELTLDALGGRFRPLIVWALFWGARPFSDLMRHVPGITKKALRRELVEMEKLGLVCRELHRFGNRRAEYSLSALGQTLRPVVGALYEWGLLCLRLEPSLRAAMTGAEPPRRGRPPVLPDDERPGTGRQQSGKENSRWT